jgi:hypothetical protein
MPSYTLHTLSTGYPHHCCPMTPSTPNYFSVLPIIHCFVSLGELPILFCGLIFHINSPSTANNVSSLVSALITRAIGVLTQLLIACTCPVMSSLMKRYFQPSTDHFFLLPQGFQPLRPFQLSSSYPTPSSKFRSLLLQPLPNLLLAQLLLLFYPLHLVVLILEFLTHYLRLQCLPSR